jgi:hypothetical protein
MWGSGADVLIGLERIDFLKNKVNCRNSRPLTIACHMKNLDKSFVCFLLVPVLSLCFFSLPLFLSVSDTNILRLFVGVQTT